MSQAFSLLFINLYILLFFCAMNTHHAPTIHQSPLFHIYSFFSSVYSLQNPLPLLTGIPTSIPHILRYPL